LHRRSADHVWDPVAGGSRKDGRSRYGFCTERHYRMKPTAAYPVGWGWLNSCGGRRRPGRPPAGGSREESRSCNGRLLKFDHHPYALPNTLPRSSYLSLWLKGERFAAVHAVNDPMNKKLCTHRGRNAHPHLLWNTEPKPPAASRRRRSAGRAWNPLQTSSRAPVNIGAILQAEGERISQGGTNGPQMVKCPLGWEGKKLRGWKRPRVTNVHA
jgi:hypothetical protein